MSQSFLSIYVQYENIWAFGKKVTRCIYPPPLDVDRRRGWIYQTRQSEVLNRRRIPYIDNSQWKKDSWTNNDLQNNMVYMCIVLRGGLTLNTIAPPPPIPQNNTQKTNDRATRTPLKIWGGPRCSGRVGIFCSTSGTRHVAPVIYPVLNHEWGKDRGVLFVKVFLIFCNFTFEDVKTD